MTRWRVVRVVVMASLLHVALARPASAYEGDHYVWTYYLALHLGYTERQAFQIASAAYAIDWDIDTGPMGTWKDWGEIAQGSPSLDLRNIWLRYHAFTDSVHTELGDQFIEARKNEHKERLWGLAVSERNPGPLLHYTQDYHAHFGWENIRGHATAGHRPDFIDADLAKAWAMTHDTIDLLLRFRREVLNTPTERPDVARYDRFYAVLRRLAAINRQPTSPRDLKTAPQPEPSRRIVVGSIKQDRDSGLLPALPPTWVADLPARRLEFGFDTLGHVDGDRTEFAVEQIAFNVLTPSSRVTPSGDSLAVTVEVPYTLSGVAFLPYPETEPVARPLPVLETHVVGNLPVPYRQHALRETSPGRDPGSFVARQTVTLPASAFASGPLTWVVTIQPFGLAPREIVVPVRYRSELETNNDRDRDCGAAVARHRGAVDAIAAQAASAISALNGVRAVRDQALASNGEAMAILAELRRLSALLAALEPECGQAGPASLEATAALERAVSQAREQSEWAASFAQLACELANQAPTADPAQLDQRRTDVAAFARQSAAAAAEAQAFATEAAERASAVAARLSSSAGLEQRKASLESELNALRARAVSVEAGLDSIEARARAPIGGLQPVAAGLASITAEIDAAIGGCPALSAVRSAIDDVRQRLLAARNLSIGESEAVVAQVAAVRSALNDADGDFAQIDGRMRACAPGGARGSLEAARAKAAQASGFASAARASAARAAACANIGAGPRSPGVRPADPDPRNPGGPNPPGVETGGSVRPPGGEAGGPRGAVPPGEPAGANPWDEAAGRGTPGAGVAGNPWDQAVRGRAPGGTSSPNPPGGTAPPPVNMDDLLASAAALGDPPACNYEAAQAVLLRGGAQATADPRAAVLFARISVFMTRRATAQVHYQVAHAQLAANDLNGALASAVAARDQGSPCDRANATNLVALIENALNRGRVADRQRVAAESRAAAAAVLGDLINIYNQGVAAQGGSPPPATAPAPASGGRANGAGTPRTPGASCSIQRSSAAEEAGAYWAVIAFPATPQVTNYLLMPFIPGDLTPQQWAAAAEARMSGAGRPEVRGQGSQPQMESLARQLCPNPFRPPVH